MMDKLIIPGVAGIAVTKICHAEVARTDLQEKELRKLGLERVNHQFPAEFKQI